MPALLPRTAQPIMFLLLITGVLLFTDALSQKKKRKDPSPSPAKEIVLAENKFTRYRIVLPATPSASEQKAATVLQRYLLEISGAALPIMSADQDTSRYEILLGRNDRLDELALNIDFNSLGDDGFTIKTDSLRLIIAGNDKGTLHGVYSFLEEYLGCRMYSPKTRIIPKKGRIALCTINNTQVPVIGFRTAHYSVTWDAAYID